MKTKYNLVFYITLKKEQIEDQKFIVTFGKIYGSITKLEQNKYLPPKFSESANDLAKGLGFYYEQIINTVNNNYSTIQQVSYLSILLVIKEVK